VTTGTGTPTEAQNCADGILGWSTEWIVPENRVIVEVLFAEKADAVAFADEMGERFRG
jgi:hypothetical protein